MKHHGPLFFFFLLGLTAAITLACGSPMAPPIICGAAASSASASGVLESISVCPAVIDAGNYPGDQVQFTAFGTYTSPPSAITPITPQSWGACYQGAPTNAVSVNSKGLARCLGSPGTYTVFASDAINCDAIGPCGSGCQVTGTAQLTCP